MLALTTIEARDPVTVPMLTVVPVLVAFWLMPNEVELIIREMTVPNGIPVPEIG